MSLDPIKTTNTVAERYRSYLSTTFRFRNKRLQNQLEAKLELEKFIKGPILESTSPFTHGSNLEKLIQEGLISEGFRRLDSEELPLGRELWTHQEDAIRKVIGEEKNIVVATGTGSGKTECFLIPIINHLLREEKTGKLGPGVRALLLYPMNALANDQLKRLRNLLSRLSPITFGRYTGETEEDEQDALEKYRRVNQQEPPDNEMLSRKEMKECPPHILITNYAMLEYLMLRPDDHVFFDGEKASFWKYLVLDEAHTYDGATGIEMSMLIRRLIQRIDTSQDRMQYIATSATLGGGEEGKRQIAKFASKLFDANFNLADVILADRKNIQQDRQELEKPGAGVYRRWLEIVRNEQDDYLGNLQSVGRKAGYSKKLLNKAADRSKGKERKFLFEVLSKDKRLNKLQGLLEEKPYEVDRIVKDVFEEQGFDDEDILALVELSVKAKSGDKNQPLLPARFHSFVRSIEGAFLLLSPSQKLYLERREKVEVNGEEFKVFEVATCRNCGAHYLVGEKNDEEPQKLVQPGRKYYEDDENLEYFMVMEEEIGIQENEDEIVAGGDFSPNGESYKVCGKCGAIEKSNYLGEMCEHDDEYYHKLKKVESDAGDVHKCIHCGKVNTNSSVVWRFLLGKDAIAGVLGTSLYEELPEKKIETNGKTDSSGGESGWSYHGDSATERVQKSPNKKRQLLIFSDSRQDAAFFAPYLERTHEMILRRRLIVESINENADSVASLGWRLDDLHKALVKKVRGKGIWPEKSPQQESNQVWRWIYDEFLGVRGQSLEELGVLGFSLVKPDDWVPPDKLTNGIYELESEEVWGLFQVLFNSLRNQYAVEFPSTISARDSYFPKYLTPRSFREYNSSKGSQILSWIPKKGYENARSNFMSKLFEASEGQLKSDGISNILKKLWGKYFAFNHTGSPWSDYVTKKTIPGEGLTYRLNYKMWEIEPSFVEGDGGWFKCNKCNHITNFNVKNVCPKYRCDGELEKIYPSEEFGNHHYRGLYFSANPAKMKVREHTAQLNNQAAADLQTRFKEGDVDVLSCSTTFELGVDVGELEAVFMRNVPPTPANYVQRAGRAGRRTDSTAFALTFAQRRSHDLSYFARPNDMVNGEIEPPHFDIKNEKIIRRHMYAMALAKFWKRHPEKFKDVRSFVLGGDKNGLNLVQKYLELKPQDLEKSLEEVVPNELHSKIGVKNWDWTSQFLSRDEGVLTKVTQDVKSDLEELHDVRRERFENGKNVDYIKRTIEHIKNRYLLSFLSSRNVIPKYGFPVDVVELNIPGSSRKSDPIELSRDLKIALSEYAPGSQVVANGKVWTSRYLKTSPRENWPKYKFAICDECNHYQRELAEKESPMDTCEKCGAPLKGGIKEFVIPEFGFMAERKPGSPGERRPERTYTTRAHFSGEAEEEDVTEFELNRSLKMQLTSARHGKLAIINNGKGQGFYICHSCGYTHLGRKNLPESHKTPWGEQCSGELSKRPYSLGHEFETDILEIEFKNYRNEQDGFWYSLLYAILEGASEALNIERDDLSGTLYYTGDTASPNLVLYDDVPGGAGHVKRINSNKRAIENVLEKTRRVVERCDCGGKDKDTSCYGCLRNFQNQFVHDRLSRGKVIKFLERHFSY